MSDHPEASAADSPLDPELRALLDDTRLCDEADPAYDDAARRRVLGRLERALGDAPAGGRTLPKLRSGVMLASVCLLATFAGSKLVEHGRGDAPAPAASTLAAPPAAFSPISEPAPAHGDDVPTTHVDDLPSSASVPSPPAPARAPRANAPSAVTTARTGTDLAEEYRLVEGARASLAARDYSSALRSIREHAHRFPTGQLEQECESLHIQTLVEMGRLGEARERAQRFQARFPNGLLLPSVTRAIASSPDSALP